MLIKNFIIIYVFLDYFILWRKLKVEIALTNFYLSTLHFFVFFAASSLSATIWACSDIPTRMYLSKTFSDWWPVMLRISLFDSTPVL